MGVQAVFTSESQTTLAPTIEPTTAPRRRAVRVRTEMDDGPVLDPDVSPRVDLVPTANMTARLISRIATTKSPMSHLLRNSRGALHGVGSAAPRTATQTNFAGCRLVRMLPRNTRLSGLSRPNGTSSHQFGPGERRAAAPLEIELAIGVHGTRLLASVHVIGYFGVLRANPASSPQSQNNRRPHPYVPTSQFRAILNAVFENTVFENTVVSSLGKG